MRRTITTWSAGLALTAALAAGAAAPASALAVSDRLPAIATVTTPDYDFELVLVDSGESVDAFVRRTDDVGNSVIGPDAHGARQHSSWGVTGGRRCLTSSGGEFAFPDSVDHGFTYGLAGRSVRRVVVVMEDGDRASTRTTHRTVGGFRGWLLERPLGAVDRIEGRDARGRTVAVIDQDDFFDDFGLASTCTTPPPE
jgi:hypothetical protein